MTTNRAGADIPYSTVPADRIGVRPPGFRLPDAAHVGAVAIQVASLERSLDFYEGVIGYRVLERSDGATGPVALLGNQSDDRVLFELHEKRGVRPVPRRGLLGLYHSAALLPSRGDLGRFLTHAASRGVHIGSSDHVVSEALYLVDPDGLTVEVYRDRPRSEWIVNEHGEIVTGMLPLDLDSLQRDGGGTAWGGLPHATTIGHVHFYIGDLAGAAAFYHDGLGFDRVVSSLPGALFVSAGGYHHHVGLNIWAAGSPIATDDDARILRWDLVLPDAVAIAAASSSLEKGGVTVARQTDGTFATDPWGIRVQLVEAARRL